MPVAWTDPQDAVPGEDFPSSQYNDEVVGNLLYLLNRPATQVIATGNYSTTSTSYVDIDATNLTISFTTQTGNVMVWFLTHAAADAAVEGIFPHFTVGLDGSAQFTGVGLTSGSRLVNANNVFFLVRLTGIAAGSHVYRPMWCQRNDGSVGSTTVRIYGTGTGGGGGGGRTVFGVMEV